VYFDNKKVYQNTHEIPTNTNVPKHTQNSYGTLYVLPTYNKYISSTTLLVILFIYLIPFWYIYKLFLYFFRNSDTENNSSLFKTYAVDFRRLLRRDMFKAWKNNDRGANKSLIIHKTSQNNRNNIILWSIWVYLGVFG
jgi:hypothetical protein